MTLLLREKTTASNEGRAVVQNLTVLHALKVILRRTTICSVFLFLFFRHEDIRDAILSLVTIFRDNSDKLERHEYRERQLGEQLKKALAGLDKRYRSQDQAISQIADRLKALETKMVQVGRKLDDTFFKGRA